MNKCDIGFRIAYNKAKVNFDTLLDEFVVFSESFTHIFDIRDVSFTDDDCWFTAEIHNVVYNEDVIDMCKSYISVIKACIEYGTDLYYGIQYAVVIKNDKEGLFHTEKYGDLGTNHDILPQFTLQF